MSLLQGRLKPFASQVTSAYDAHDFAFDVLLVDKSDHAAVVRLLTVVAKTEYCVLLDRERECRPALELCRLAIDLGLVHHMAVDLKTLARYVDFVSLSRDHAAGDEVVLVLKQHDVVLPVVVVEPVVEEQVTVTQRRLHTYAQVPVKAEDECEYDEERCQHVHDLQHQGAYLLADRRDVAGIDPRILAFDVSVEVSDLGGLVVSRASGLPFPDSIVFVLFTCSFENILYSHYLVHLDAERLLRISVSMTSSSSVKSPAPYQDVELCGREYKRQDNQYEHVSVSGNA